LPGCGARSSGQPKRYTPEDKGESSHQYRTKQQTGTSQGSVHDWPPFVVFGFEKFDDQNRVLRRQTDEHHQSDLKCFLGKRGETLNTRFPELNARLTAYLMASGIVRSGTSAVGFEYRFIPHIGVFAEAGYNFVDHTSGRTGSNNFIQTNFGLRYAFEGKNAAATGGVPFCAATSSFRDPLVVRRHPDPRWFALTKSNEREC
jgi:hypothetical protein